MPLILPKNAYCALTNRKIQVEDDLVVCFPAFQCSRESPEFVCYDGIALRDEFEKWSLKRKVTQLVGDEWIEWYSKSNSFSVLINSESLLVVKSLVEANKFRIFFLKHVFTVDLNSGAFFQIGEQFARYDNGRVELEDAIFRWETTDSGVMIEVNRFGGLRDAITLSTHESLDLQKAIAQVMAISQK